MARKIVRGDMQTSEPKTLKKSVDEATKLINDQINVASQWKDKVYDGRSIEEEERRKKQVD